ncbi:hypothetical protein PHB09_090 [Pseudomonas phage PHB09]|uniref:Uncharacterized protein n=1 Tax=Pseudomonas phage PHB09 TaxID=2867265 RepID=A0AAE9BNF2_9CAUD|nr:hypothetical protein QGX10_gp090 [Pseudomonas phage PHB09]UAV84586.1 hypothetical protein PHB09_090 [Pseudomonas phage PHB09]
MTQDELFQRYITLELNSLAAKEDVKALTEEAKEAGFDKVDIGLIKASAKIHVADAFEEKSEAARALEAKYKELTGYDDDEPKY